MSDERPTLIDDLANDEDTGPDHVAPSVPPVFDPARSGAPKWLADVVDDLHETRDELANGMIEFLKVAQGFGDQVREVMSGMSQLQTTMDAALREMQRANQRVTAVEGTIDELAKRVAAVEAWQRDHRCHD